MRPCYHGACGHRSNGEHRRVYLLGFMMNDDEIVSVLQQDGRRLEPVAVAELLDQLTGGGLSQGAIVTYSSAHSLRSHCVSCWKRAAGAGLVVVR